MDVNLQDVIADLSSQISQLVRDNAILKAVIKSLQEEASARENASVSNVNVSE